MNVIDRRFGDQRARFELLGGTGALLAGVGIGLVFKHLLAALALPFLLIGVATHGWAMWAKHRLDAAGPVSMPTWTRWAYWGCWVLIVGLVLYLVTGTP